jgi:transcriptional regulator with XRE-family HTH domain
MVHHVAHPRFGDLLKYHRRKVNSESGHTKYTQAMLAEKLGYSVHYVSMLERGERRATVVLAHIIADALTLTPDERTELVAAARDLLDAAPATPGAVSSAFVRPPLPAPATSLLGREHEAAVVVHLLRRKDVHLLTVVGPPGIGKTRLSQHVAASLRTDFADGVVFIPLAAIRAPDLVLPEIAQTLGLCDDGRQLLLQTLAHALKDQHLLLVLDNFEQVLDARSLVARLWEQCPSLRLLVTSRAPLHLTGEQEFPLPPLALPAPGYVPPVEEVGQYAAVALFIQRAQAVKPSFRVTAAQAQQPPAG